MLARLISGVVYYWSVMSRVALVAVSVTAALTYAVLWIGMTAGWWWLSAADDWTLGRFHPESGWIGFWKLVSDVLGPTALRLAALAGIVVAILRRRVPVAAFLVVTVLAMGLVTLAAKGLADRPRPATAAVAESWTAFPSGHALGITVGVLAFGTVLWPGLRRSWRAPVAAVGAALVVLVGLARVALHVHHVSDVVAGCALGVLYYLLCLTLVPPHPPPRS